MHLCADASGSSGGGAFWCVCWLQTPCSLYQPGKLNIVQKEPFAVIASYLWAKQKILFYCMCSPSGIGHLVQGLSTQFGDLDSWFAARYDINTVVTHTYLVVTVTLTVLSPNPICVWSTPSFLYHLNNSSPLELVLSSIHIAYTIWFFCNIAV